MTHNPKPTRGRGDTPLTPEQRALHDATTNTRRQDRYQSWRAQGWSNSEIALWENVSIKAVEGVWSQIHAKRARRLAAKSNCPAPTQPETEGQ